MDTFSKTSIHCLLISLLAASINAGENCITGYSSYGVGYTYKYCINNCCGTSPYEYCCSSGWYDSDSSISTVEDTVDVARILIIVGSVIGSVLFLSTIIAIICCAVKKKNRSGVVVQPAPGIATVSSVNQHGFYPQPSMHQPAPGYQQAQNGPFNNTNQFPQPGNHPDQQAGTNAHGAQNDTYKNRVQN